MIPADGRIFPYEQNIWHHDRSVGYLLRHIHALCPSSHAEKPSLIRLPFYKFRGAVGARGAISAVLEVSISHCFYFRVRLWAFRRSRGIAKFGPAALQLLEDRIVQ